MTNKDEIYVAITNYNAIKSARNILREFYDELDDNEALIRGVLRNLSKLERFYNIKISNWEKRDD